MIDNKKAADRGSLRAAGRNAGAQKRLRSAVDHQRSEFLRLCRARTKPEDVGLAANHKARNGGLRREDVATLSGVSVSWYAWLEQGQVMRVSDEVLERVCQTFGLTEDERTYLFWLVQRRMPRVPAAVRPEVPPDVTRMLQSIAVPAIAINLRWDILAWNELNTAIYRDYGAIPQRERNLLEILLLRPVRHLDAAQLEAVAQRLCARLRYNYSNHPDDPLFESLVRRLSASSPVFNRVWHAPDFNLSGFGVHRFTNPRFGELAFEHTSYMPDGHNNLRVILCTPENVAAKRAVAEIKSELARSIG
jgi:transcriptional regulator with XRE-family HTH domain